MKGSLKPRAMFLQEKLASGHSLWALAAPFLNHQVTWQTTSPFREAHGVSKTPELEYSRIQAFLRGIKRQLLDEGEQKTRQDPSKRPYGEKIKLGDDSR